MRPRLAGAVCAGLLVPALSGLAGEPPRVTVGAVLDGRAGWSDGDASWLDGGLGKTRYGDRRILRLAQASLLLGADVTETFGARVQINVDAEPGARARRGRADLIEAYLTWRPAWSATFKPRLRAGQYFPRISLEHDGPAWTTVYTITPSAVNTWIGEEVRATGAELGLAWTRDQHEASATAGVFGGNDPAGTLLAWRGWALHDRQTGRPDELPLPPLSVIGPGRVFDRQSSRARPIDEVDDRAGFYAGGAATWAGRVQASAFHWDNRADPALVVDGQYGWATSVTVAGAGVELPGGTRVLAQHLWGRTRMGRAPGGEPMVAVSPRASYVLVTSARGRHRLTLRYDRFHASQHDVLPASDDNTEDGSAWTAAYVLRLLERHRVAFELLSVDSTRPARAQLARPARVRETLAQVSVRLRF